MPYNFFSKNVFIFRDPDENTARQQRFVVTNLRGYNFYIQKVFQNNVECAKGNHNLLNDTKFWNYHKHENAAVRSAWFEVVSTILKEAPSLLSQHYEQITKLVFKFMDETDSLVVPYIWTCIVLVQVNVPNWYTYISVEKLLLPKLFKILRTAGSGNAVVIFPYLLPLISKMDQTVVGEQWPTFHEKYFGAINEGIRLNNESKTEMNAIASAYYETLKYTLIEFSKDEKNYVKCVKLIDDNMIAMIYWAFNNKTSVASYAFSHIASVLYYLETNRNNDIYARLLKHFWSELLLVFKSSLESRSNFEQNSANHIELIRCLKNSNKTKKTNIRFAADTVDSSKPTADVGICTELPNIVRQLCKLYVEKIIENKTAVLVENFEILVKDFHDEQLFIGLANGKL